MSSRLSVHRDVDCRPRPTLTTGRAVGTLSAGPGILGRRPASSPSVRGVGTFQREHCALRGRLLPGLAIQKTIPFRSLAPFPGAACGAPAEPVPLAPGRSWLTARPRRVSGTWTGSWALRGGPKRAQVSPAVTEAAGHTHRAPLPPRAIHQPQRSETRLLKLYLEITYEHKRIRLRTITRSLERRQRVTAPFRCDRRKGPAGPPRTVSFRGLVQILLLDLLFDTHHTPDRVVSALRLVRKRDANDDFCPAAERTPKALAFLSLGHCAIS